MPPLRTATFTGNPTLNLLLTIEFLLYAMRHESAREKLALPRGMRSVRFDSLIERAVWLSRCKGANPARRKPGQSRGDRQHHQRHLGGDQH
jgi:hypothetical protein